MNTKQKEEKIDLKDILVWIIDNSGDQDAMDKISNSSFVYSSKFKKYYDKPQEGGSDY
jgi:hypothetical protein